VIKPGQWEGLGNEANCCSYGFIVMLHTKVVFTGKIY